MEVNEQNPEIAMLTVRGEHIELMKALYSVSQYNVNVGIVAPERVGAVEVHTDSAKTLGYYNFSQITSPRQWFGREHMQGFHKAHASHFDNKTPAQVFNALVSPSIRPKKGNQGNPRPIAPDSVTQSTSLIVSTRKEQHLPAFPPNHASSAVPRETLEKVVQVGSLFSFYARLQDDAKLVHRLHYFHNPDSAKRQFFDLLITQLQKQLQLPASSDKETLPIPK